MPDVFSKKKRSAVMALIRSRGNQSTEARLIAVFRLHGITGWRRGKRLEWKIARGELKPFRVHPDFVFRAQKLAVFVDGCFWHGCPIHGTQPKQNAAFWRKKIATNRTRDRLVTRSLRARGWKVLRLWEHELARKHARRLLGRLRRSLDAD